MAVLESLGCAYHLLAIHDALRADNTIEIEKVDRSSLYKARECFLILLDKADELYLQAMMKREGGIIYDTFFFEQDNYRILTLYPTLIKNSPNDVKIKRDFEMKYAKIVCQSGYINLTQFHYLTEEDKILLSILEEEHAMLHILDFKNPEVLRRNSDFPDHFYQFCHRQTGISGAKALIPLNSEDQFQVFAFAPVIQESIVTDLLETSRKYMHQVSAYEFSIVQCNAPAWFTRFPATCGKSHFFVSDVYNPAVGNSNFMCVSAKILNSIAKSVESLFNIRTPVFVVKTVSEFRLFVGVTEFFTGRGKYHLLLFIKGIQFSEIFSLEFIPEDFDRNEKRTFTFSYLLVCSQSTARNDTVHMYMVFHLLIPCMQP